MKKIVLKTYFESLSKPEGAYEFIRELPTSPSAETKSRQSRSRSRNRERERGRHTSRDRTPSSERVGANLRDNPMAISQEQGGEKPRKRGEWLEKEHKRLLEEQGMEIYSEPTEEIITQQVMLPTQEMVDGNKFNEPIKNRVAVDKPSDFCQWSREGLPEEEIVRPPDWSPPTPPRVDISLMSYIDPNNRPGEDEERRAKRKKAEKVYQNKDEVLNDLDLREDKEIVVYDTHCVLRTKQGVMERKRKAELESLDFDMRRGRGGGFRGRGGRCGRRGRGGYGGGRGREEDNVIFAKLEPRSRKRERSQSSSPGRFSPREQSSRSSEHPDRKDRSRDRDWRQSSSSYDKKPNDYDKKLSAYDRSPSAYDRKPSAYDRKPSAYDRQHNSSMPSSSTDKMLSSSRKTPSVYDKPTPSSSNTFSSSYDSRGSSSYIRPSVHTLNRSYWGYDMRKEAPSRTSSTSLTGIGGIRVPQTYAEHKAMKAARELQMY